ncbi:MAG: hypothetical protein V4466_00785 [Pseudomonadota bacterium]
MRFVRVAAVVAGLLFTAAAAPASAQSLSRKLDLLRLQEDAGTATVAVLQSEGKACAGQLPAMKTILADPRFDRMDADARRAFLYALMLCSEVKDAALALSAAARLEPLASDPAEVVAVYSVKMSDALQRGATAEAANLFLTLSDKEPAAVGEWEPEMLAALSDDIAGEPELTLKVLRRLVGLDWTNAASQRAARNDWALSLAKHLADSGQTDEAVAALARADEPYVLLMVAGDRRFAALWDRYQAEGRFAWTALAEADLARARVEMAAAPARLRPVHEILAALRGLGRYEEAIEIGQAYQARIEDGELFEDSDPQANQVLLDLAQSLFDTGRTDQAQAVFKAVLARSADAPSVDGSLAWAGRLLDLGRPKEALAVLDAVDRDYMTPYGLFWLDSQRVCAMADIDPKTAAPTLALLEKGRDENPGALSQALLCLNRIDDAAALLAWRLASPRHRSGGLDPWWGSRPPPFLPPESAEFERRRQAMLAHPDSVKALAAVGRRVETTLAGDYWGGF